MSEAAAAEIRAIIDERIAATRDKDATLNRAAKSGSLARCGGRSLVMRSLSPRPRQRSNGSNTAM